MNNDILSQLNRDCNDSIVDDENECLQNSIPIEFVDSITPNGLPLHKLILKIGAKVKWPLLGQRKKCALYRDSNKF